MFPSFPIFSPKTVEPTMVDIRIVFGRMSGEPRGPAMDDQITAFQDSGWDDEGAGEPQAIGDILADLLAQYQARFPEVNITVVEISSAA
jgi:hypothetical protein